MIELESLLGKFRNINDLEFNNTIFKTNVKAIAPYAYLNTIFKAGDEEIQKEIIDPLLLPNDLREFYHYYNGASLFSDLLSIYGFLPKFYLLNRKDWRTIFPYDILELNNYLKGDDSFSEIIIIGSYGFDRSAIFIDRKSLKIYCATGDDLNNIRASWPSFEVWIRDEIRRLSLLHDEEGNLIVEMERSLPGDI